MRDTLLLFLFLFLFGAGVPAQTITTAESRCINTGEITFSGTIGSGSPYQFLVTHHPSSYTPGPAQPANDLPFTFTALFPGTYSITVRDGLGMVFNFPGIQVTGNYVLPGNNDYSPVATGVTSCPVPNGKIQGVMTNGRPPYTYTIISGPSQTGTINTSGTFLRLAAGNYRVQAEDSCRNAQTRDITVTDSTTSLSIVQAFLKRTGCNVFSLDSIKVLPAFPQQGRYEVINYNSSGTGVVRASGNSFPVSFPLFSHTDIPNGKVTIYVYDTCGNRVSYIPLTYKDYVRDTITGGIINRVGCNRYSLNVLTRTPPLQAGDTVQLTNTATGVVYRAPLPVYFTAAPADITAGLIVVQVTDTCGTVTTARLNTVNNNWDFSPALKIYCSTVVIDSLVFSGFIVRPYTVTVKALFTDSTGIIDSTSEQVVTSFPHTVAGIGRSPNPLTLRIEVRDSCGETRRSILTQSFLLASGVMRPVGCGVTSIDLSLLGRYVLPVTYSVSPDPGVGINSTGHFELPEGIYSFTARDSCGKQASLGPLDFSRSWSVAGKQFKECSEQFITNSISVPARSSGRITVRQYEGTQPVTTASSLLRTKQFTSASNDCVSCSDSTVTGELIKFDSTLPGRIYTYIVSDTCGRADTVTIANDTVPLSFYHRAFSKTKCVSGSNVYANWKSNGDPLNSVLVEVYDADNNILVGFNTGSITNMNNYPNGQLLLSDAPQGMFIIKYKLLNCLQEYTDTIFTRDYIQPGVRTAESFAPCSSGNPLVVTGVEGIAPYQYEIVNSVPGNFTSPSQTSSVFTLPISQSAVTIRITDACLNSSTRTVAVTKALPPVIRSSTPLLSACTLPFTFSLVTDSFYAGAVFRWTKITGSGAGPSIIGTGTALPVVYNTLADTGTYNLNVTIPNTCFNGSSTFTVGNIPVTCSPGIAGNVFNDANGLTDNLVNGRGDNAGGLYAVLIGSSDLAEAVCPVTAQGAYGFTGIVQGNYSIVLSINSPALNAPAPPGSLPGGWIHTGEYAGGHAGNDGAVNGSISNIVVDTGSITELNFGIERLPTARDTIESRTNPGGNIRIPVPVMTGSDAEDGIYDGVSGINTVVIRSLPVNAVLYYNGIAVVAGQTIQYYDPSLLTLDPDDNIASASFTFSEVDAAMQQSMPATVTVIFYGLPVHIISLTAKPHNGKVLIRWQTGEQVNIVNYIVESSTDGIEFIQVGSVAAGNTQDYRFVHVSPSSGINFYRLRIMESDGAFSYSKVFTAHFSATRFVQVMPNPFSNNLLLATGLVTYSPVKVFICDAAGKKVYDIRFKGNPGSNYFQIDNLSKLSGGVYIITVIAGDTIFNCKLLKE